MKQIDLKIAMVCCLVFCLLGACSPARQNGNEAATASATSTNTMQPSATLTFTPTVSPTVTATATLSLPVAIGTPLQDLASVISPANAGQLIQVAKWGKGNPKRISWSPDGSTLAVLTVEKLFLYETQTFQEFSINLGGDNMIFSADGSMLAILQRGGQFVFLINLKNGIAQPKYYSYSTNGAFYIDGGMAFSPDGRYLAVVFGNYGSSVDDFVQVFNTQNLDLIETINGNLHQSNIDSITFTAAGYLYMPEQLWNVSKNQKICDLGALLAYLPEEDEYIGGYNGSHNLKRYNGNCTFVENIGYDSGYPDWVLSSDAHYAAAVKHGSPGLKNIYLWRISDGKELFTIYDVKAWIFSLDETSILYTDKNNNIFIKDIASGKVVNKIPGDASEMIESFDFVPGSGLLAVRTAKSYTLWDLSNNTVRQTIGGLDTVVENGGLMEFSFDPSGRFLLGYPFRGSILQIWDLAKGEKVITLNYSYSLSDIEYTSDGKTLVVGTDNGEVLLIDPLTGEMKKYLAGCCESPSISISPDNDRVISAMYGGGHIFEYDLRDGTQIASIDGSDFYTTQIVFSPDGEEAATAGDGKKITLWDTQTWKVKKTFKGYTDWVTAMAFSPDGKILAAGSQRGETWLWDVQSGVKTELNSQMVAVEGIAFSPDGQKVIFTDQNGYKKAAIMWDVEHKTQLFQIHGPRIGGKVSFSPDGSLILINDLFAIDLFDAADGHQVETIPGYEQEGNYVYKAVFSPDGKTIAAIYSDGTVRLWGAASR